MLWGTDEGTSGGLQLMPEGVVLELDWGQCCGRFSKKAVGGTALTFAKLCCRISRFGFWSTQCLYEEADISTCSRTVVLVQHGHGYRALIAVVWVPLHLHSSGSAHARHPPGLLAVSLPSPEPFDGARRRFRLLVTVGSKSTG